MTRATRRSGASAVEFALTLPMIFLILAAILDFGWFMSKQHTVMQGTRDAVRYSVRNTDDPDVAAALASAMVVSWLDALNEDCTNGGCSVESDTIVVNGMAGIELVVSVPVQPMMGVVMPIQNASTTYSMLLENQPDE